MSDVSPSLDSISVPGPGPQPAGASGEAFNASVQVDNPPAAPAVPVSGVTVTAGGQAVVPASLELEDGWRIEAPSLPELVALAATRLEQSHRNRDEADRAISHWERVVNILNNPPAAVTEETN